MSFFDKKQDVIDIKLTQFGKNLLSRGAFKPYYYRFFDDDILYDATSAGISEKQNRSQERIFEAQRMRTQHLSVGVENTYDDISDMIESGSIKTFMEIKRSQSPLVSEKMLKYPLESATVNDQEAPRFDIAISGSKFSSFEKSIQAAGITLPVPQLNITSSYCLERSSENKTSTPLANTLSSKLRSYFDLTSRRIEFLDKTTLEVIEGPVIIDLEEVNVNDILENFELEIYEIIEQGAEVSLKRIKEEPEIKKLFKIEVGESVQNNRILDRRSDIFK